MHEFSLLADLLHKIESIAREQGVGRILSVKVKLGALSHISPSCFREHFVRVSNGTLVEGARVDIEVLTDVTDPNAQGIFLDCVEVDQ